MKNSKKLRLTAEYDWYEFSSAEALASAILAEAAILAEQAREEWEAAYRATFDLEMREMREWV